MPTIRKRANGTFELRVVHRLLPRPFYATFDDHHAATDYGQRLVVALDRGDVPPELREAAAARSVTLEKVLGTYLTNAPVAASDRPLVEFLQSTLAMRLEGLTLRWVDGWVRGMKRDDRLAPGTIRKRVESLARAVDWWNRREHQADAVPANPLRMLPRGYSAYGPDDGPVKVDKRRDRRLAPGEAEAIEAAILGQKRPDRQRALNITHRDHFLLLWRVIVNTGLRLREAYKLRPVDVDYKLRTIFVAAGKTGVARDVPMTRQVHDWLRDSRTANTGDLLFPFWSGEPEELRNTTNRLSAQFAQVFEYSGIEGLTEHDLRHEATCRWMLMKDEAGRWLFRPEEVRRITGHRNVQQFERYLSLRGSDLAERLWA